MSDTRPSGVERLSTDATKLFVIVNTISSGVMLLEESLIEELRSVFYTISIGTER